VCSVRKNAEESVEEVHFCSGTLELG